MFDYGDVCLDMLVDLKAVTLCTIVVVDCSSGIVSRVLAFLLRCTLRLSSGLVLRVLR